MKIILLFIINILIISINSYCQEEDKKFAIGIKFGLGPGTFENIDKYKTDYYGTIERLNNSIGLTTNFKLNKILHIGSDLTYNHRGGGFSKATSNIISINSSNFQTIEKPCFYHIHYISSLDLPIYLQIAYNSLFFTSGINPSLILNETHKYNSFDTTSNYFFINQSWHTEEIKNLNNTISIAYFFGFGLRIRTHKIIFQPEFRFTRYLNNELIVDNQIQSSKNTLYTIFLSVLFNTANKHSP